MPKKSYKKKHLTSFQLIILGFAGVILLGSILLMLPFSSVDRIPTPFHEALFTATSAVCVTGLVVKDTGSYWSLAGQTIILVLIQIGITRERESGCQSFILFPLFVMQDLIFWEHLQILFPL